ncbi:hypothetical protein ACLBKU_09605 [Erythrobacter sp. NE805]|uniref:hypothetical protein n=1 Tax=Erythrobacter sp. NE805 TaxID=3389875 RepID=UPI00396B1985
MVAAITLLVVGVDYQYKWKIPPEYFVNHILDVRKRIFFETYEHIFRFCGLAFLWCGFVGIYFLRESADSFEFLAACLVVIIGGILYISKDGWMFLMKKKNK